MSAGAGLWSRRSLCMLALSISSAAALLARATAAEHLQGAIAGRVCSADGVAIGGVTLTLDDRLAVRRDSSSDND